MRTEPYKPGNETFGFPLVRMNCRIRSRLNFRGTPSDPCRSLPQLPALSILEHLRTAQPEPFRSTPCFESTSLAWSRYNACQETYILVCGWATRPADYRGDILAAEHGSWNRSVRVGYDAIRISLH